MPTLVLSSRATEDNQALWRAAVARPWNVERARGPRAPVVADDEIAIYAESLFAPAIARELGRTLIELPVDWLVRLPVEYRRRDVQLRTLGQARAIRSPAFVKPPNDKSFPAAVYADGSFLPVEFDDTMPVLVAEPVRWRDEFRCFLLDGVVKTLSPYLRGLHFAKEQGFAADCAELAAASAFAETVAADGRSQVPRAVVLDVGTLESGEWAVVEANAAWGAGLYGCDADAALDVIAAATVRP